MPLLVAAQSPPWKTPLLLCIANSKCIKTWEVWKFKMTSVASQSWLFSTQSRSTKGWKPVMYNEVLFKSISAKANWATLEGKVSEAHCSALLLGFFWPPTQLSVLRHHPHCANRQGCQRWNALICICSYTVLKSLISLKPTVCCPL